MYELNFKNYFKSLLLLVVGIAISSGISFLRIAPVEIPVPVYILGILTGFLILSFIFYSKASIGQTLQIAIIGILINAVCLAGGYFLNEYYQLPQIILKPDFILLLNPAIIGISFLFSLFALCVGVKLEKIEEESFEDTNPEEINEEKEGISENTTIAKQEHSQDTEVVKFKFSEKNNCVEKPESMISDKNEQRSKSPATYEEIYPQNSEYITEVEEIFLENMTSGENLLEEEKIIMDNNEEMELKEKNILLDRQNEVNSEAMDFIPTDIRLSETLTSRETESKGRIGAIGKLLVNNRNIENVIEAGEIAEEGPLNNKINIITSVSGEQIYKKFSELKNEFVGIKEVALVDQGGFILANDFKDKQRVQLAGALVAGTYHTLQNYLAQLSLSFPVRIFFETANANSFIVKTRDAILFSTWDKEFKHIEYGPVNEILEAEDFSQIDITPYADLMRIENFTVTDFKGNIINSFGNPEISQPFAAVSSAIFENLKVFLMNIQLMNLSKIVVFTPHKVMTIIKMQDKIIALLTNLEDFPKIKEELLKMEKIY